MKTLVYFEVSDLVVLKDPPSSCILGKNTVAALAKGPLTVVEAISVPPVQCDCYGIPHTSTCPESGGEWGWVGHPQWVILADRNGEILRDLYSSGRPSHYSGAWFEKATPTTATSSSRVR